MTAKISNIARKLSYGIVASGAMAAAMPFTALAAVDENKEWFLPAVVTDADSADFRIMCNPVDGQLGRCRDVLDTVFTGFEILAGEYPDYVRTTKED